MYGALRGHVFIKKIGISKEGLYPRGLCREYLFDVNMRRFGL